MTESSTFFSKHGELYLHPLIKFSMLKCEHERGVELSVLVRSFVFMIHNNTLRRLLVLPVVMLWLIFSEVMVFPSGMNPC